MLRKISQYFYIFYKEKNQKIVIILIDLHKKKFPFVQKNITYRIRTYVIGV